jgi:hypothetical protein
MCGSIASSCRYPSKAVGASDQRLRELSNAEMRDAGKGDDRRSLSSDTTVKQAKLLELGITRDQFQKRQKFAEIPEKGLEEALRDPRGDPSTATLIRKARRVKGDARQASQLPS